MKRIVIGGLLALAVATSAAAADRKADRRYVELYNRFARTVAENFYDPNLHGANWQTVVQHYRPRLRNVRTDQDFHRLGQQMLVELASTRAELRMPTEAEDDWTGVGVRAWKMGKDLVIQEVDPLSDARRQGLQAGDVILTSERELLGPAGSAVSLRIRSCEGPERLVSVRREGAFDPLQRPTFRWSVLRAGEDRRIGYLRIDGFEDDGAELADRAMADLKDTDALIIDVRAAAEGSASALRLASYFTEGPQPGFVLLSRPWLMRRGGLPDAGEVLAAPKAAGVYTRSGARQALAANGGAAALWTEDLGPRRYTAPVIVLQGEGTAGGAEGFARLMKLKTRATVMGRKTAGALADFESFDLGQGWSVRLPTHGVWAADGNNYGDRPAPPQVVIPMSRAAMCAGRDADLEAAVDRLTGARPAV